MDSHIICLKNCGRKKANQALLQLAPDTAEQEMWQQSILTLTWCQILGVLWQQR